MLSIRNTATGRCQTTGEEMDRKNGVLSRLGKLALAFAASALLPLMTSCIASRASTEGPATITSFAVSTPTTAATSSLESVPGAPVVLSWVVSHAAKITISDGANQVMNASALSASSIQLNPTVSATYTLTAIGGDGSSVSTIAASTGATPAAVTVTIVPLPTISAFTATPSTIAKGQSTTLSWTVANATSLSMAADPVGGGFGTSFSVTGTSSVQQPEISTIYTLSATGLSGMSVSATLTVTVNDIPLPMINSFTASKINIVAGGSSTLSWSVVNAPKLTLQAVDANNPTPGIQADVSGQTSLVVMPKIPTTYTLVAANSAGVTATSSPLTINASSCPPPNIYSFTSDPISLGPNNPVSLTATFDGGLANDLGVGTVDMNVGTVISGNPVTTSSLSASTTFNLKVTNGCGSSSTAAAQVPVGNIVEVAGSGSSGSQDGMGTGASFYTPYGIAVDSSANLYVADLDNNTIRMITPQGNVTTIAGVASTSGSIDGPPGTGLLNTPQGVAVDTAGNVYVADTGNSTIREIAAGSHNMTTIAGTPGLGGYQDGTGSSALFSAPTALAVDAHGVVYVSDTGNSDIRAIAPGGVVTTLAGSNSAESNVHQGYADGTGAAALFYNPSGMVMASDGNLYVADTINYVIRKVTTSGVVTTIAGTPSTMGYIDGTGSAAQLGIIRAIVSDPTGTLYVGDTSKYALRRLTFINNAYTVDTIAGDHGPAIPPHSPSGPLPGKLPVINGMALDPASGNIYMTLPVFNSVYSLPY